MTIAFKSLYITVINVVLSSHEVVCCTDVFLHAVTLTLLSKMIADFGEMHTCTLHRPWGNIVILKWHGVLEDKHTDIVKKVSLKLMEEIETCCTVMLFGCREKGIFFQAINFVRSTCKS